MSSQIRIIEIEMNAQQEQALLREYAEQKQLTEHPDINISERAKSECLAIEKMAMIMNISLTCARLLLHTSSAIH